MFCPSCRSQQADNARFCAVCGASLAPTGATPSPGGRGINIDSDGRGMGRGYSFEILHQPSFSLAVVQLQSEQSILAEAGAMVSMSANVELQSEMKGGLFGALKRAVGVGIGLLPEAYLGWAIRGSRRSAVKKDLVRVLPEYGSTGAELTLVSPPTAYEPARVRLFRDFLTEQLRPLMQACETMSKR